MEVITLLLIIVVMMFVAASDGNRAKSTIKQPKSSVPNDDKASEEPPLEQPALQKTISTSLDIVQRATIAKLATKELQTDELVSVLEILEHQSEMLEAIDVFNNRMTPRYLVHVKDLVSRSHFLNKELNDLQLEINLKECMELGRTLILKSSEVAPFVHASNSCMGKQLNIAKSRSWDELKGEF